MDIKLITGLAALMSAGAALAVVTIEGIDVTEAGITMSKKCLGVDRLGQFPDGFWIDGIADALEAVERGYVVYDFTSETKRVCAGYIGGEHGRFNYEESDAGFAAGRWEQSSSGLFGGSCSIVVPEAGKWTFALGGRDGSWTSLSVQGADVEFYETRKNGNADEILFAVIDFPAAGAYALEAFEYFPDNGAWMELSVAKGEKDSFNTTDFRLIGLPLTTYTVSFGYTDDKTGEISLGSQDVLKGYKLSKPADPVRSGYAFVGWYLNDVPYDFDQPVGEDLALVAKWVRNYAPAIREVTYSPARPVIEGATVGVTLSVDAYDLDFEPLTYQWSVVGDAPAPYSFADMHAAETIVNLGGDGDFTFSVTVSDGHETATQTVTVTVGRSKNATSFSFVGPEFAGSPIGHQGTVQDPVLADYQWGAANHDGYKAAWRSTDSGPKNWLLDTSSNSINAYGLDGYIFPGRCLRSDAESGDFTVDNVTSGTPDADGMTVSNVTDYIASFSWQNGAVGTGPGIYWIDDPTLPISSDVKDFKPGDFTVQNVSMDAYTAFATIRLSSHAARYPKIRVGILSGYGDGFKPKAVSVGGAAHDWVGSGEGYGHLTWMFFDIDNPKNGNEIALAIMGENTWSSCRIEGIVFDSIYKEPGFVLTIR